MPRTRIEELAVFGSRPCFSQALHVGRPNIGDRDRILARIGDMLDRRWLTNNGPLVQEFEGRLASYLGVKHVVVMCNATVALEIAIRALGMKGEVIVPSFTFVATAHALQWQEITPVFCDIDPLTHALDPACVERLITPRTTGILGVHTWGRPCAVEPLTELARRRGLKLLFDAAHAFGCSHRGRMIGGFGHAEVFSFHATKFFNTFEGGAVATDDGDLAAKIRLMKNFGFAGYDRVIYLGINGKMSEPSAAMGLSGLDAIDDFVAANRRNYEAYGRGLAGLPGLSLIAYGPAERNNYQYIAVEVDASAAGLTRDELVRVLHAENVIARRYFHPGCHRMEPYRTLFPEAGRRLPNTERLTERVLCLPTGTAVTGDDVGQIASILRVALEHAPEISRQLALPTPDPGL